MNFVLLGPANNFFPYFPNFLRKNNGPSLMLTTWVEILLKPEFLSSVIYKLLKLHTELW